MHGPSNDSTTRPSPAATRLLLALGAGCLLGHVVLALADQHHGAPSGLGFALVFVLSGSISVTLLLKHLHGRRRPRRPAPVADWLIAIGAGLLMTLQLAGG